MFFRAINIDFPMIRLYIEVGFSIGVSPFTMRHSARQTTNAESDFLALYGFAGTLMDYFHCDHVLPPNQCESYKRIL